VTIVTPSTIVDARPRASSTGNALLSASENQRNQADHYEQADQENDTHRRA
jgi:hypothetical protein